MWPAPARACLAYSRVIRGRAALGLTPRAERSRLGSERPRGGFIPGAAPMGEGEKRKKTPGASIQYRGGVGLAKSQAVPPPRARPNLDANRQTMTSLAGLSYFWPSGFHHAYSFVSQDRIMPLRPALHVRN